MKTCCTCKIEKELSDFPKDKGKKDKLSYRCKECAKEQAKIQRLFENKEEIKEYKKEWYQLHANKLRNKERENDYGISVEEFTLMLESQNNSCIICGKEFIFGNVATSPQIDHDHSCCPGTGKCCGKCVRGLLCNNCNNGLGRFKDNIEFLQRAIDYLRSYKNA